MRLSYFSVLLFILLPVLLFFHSRGVIIHDEGYILHSAEKVFNGLVPYRDFHFVYTPASLFLTSLSFFIFQTSVLASRILMLFISLLSIILIYKIVILSTKNRFYATLSVLIFVAWGPTHINFSWPVMFAIPASLATAFSLLKFLETRSEKYLILAGLLAFTIFLTKQNFGLAIFLPVSIFFLIKNARKVSYLFSFLSGYVWGVILFGIYLLFTGSLPGFIINMYLYTVERILINKHLFTDFIYVDSLMTAFLRTLLYLLPLICSAAALILLFIRRRFHLLFLPAMVGSFYLAGIRPTTDYVHLVPLLSLTGIPIVLYLRYNILPTVRIFLLIMVAGLIVLGIQTALFKGYYRWDEPLIDQNNYYGGKAKIFLGNHIYDVLEQLTGIIDEYTKPGDFIFIDSYTPMLYFISGRKEPVVSGYLKIEVDAKDYYDEVLGNLVAKKVRLLLIPNGSTRNIPIGQYIRENYELIDTITGFDIYVRNP